MQTTLDFLASCVRSFDAEASRTGNTKLLLTAAVGVGPSTVEVAYDIPAMNEYLDFIGLMTYDLHGYWDAITGINAALYSTEEDQVAYQSPVSVEWAVDYWLSHGASADKLILGLAPYGRGFTLATPGQNQGPLSPVVGASNPGPQTDEMGYLSYMEIVDMLAAGGVEYYDEARQGPYMITADGSTWVGYDNPESLAVKVEFMMSKGLAGTMAWAIELDDFRQQQWPCLKAIKEAMSGYRTDHTATITSTSGTETENPNFQTSLTETTSTATNSVDTPSFNGESLTVAPTSQPTAADSGSQLSPIESSVAKFSISFACIVLTLLLF